MSETLHLGGGPEPRDHSQPIRTVADTGGGGGKKDGRRRRRLISHVSWPPSPMFLDPLLEKYPTQNHGSLITLLYVW